MHALVVSAAAHMYLIMSSAFTFHINYPPPKNLYISVTFILIINNIASFHLNNSSEKKKSNPSCFSYSMAKSCSGSEDQFPKTQQQQQVSKCKELGISLRNKLLKCQHHLLRYNDLEEDESAAEQGLSASDLETSIYNLDEMDEDAWSLVQRNGNQFTVNGQPFYVNGFNTYWLMVLAADQSTRGKVSEVFHQASAVSLSVCRTWAFNDGQWRALQISPSVYDEQVFQALDFVVSEARKYKIRLILSLVNNWEAYGGKSQYVKWGKAAGLNLTSDDDFFSHPTLKSYYKAHVKTVLNRVNTITNITYKDDPTIFAWELINEPRCESDPSGNKLQGWIEEMAVYVKSVDPKHLLEIGLEGFYGPSTPNKVQYNPNTYAQQVGTDFIRNHQVLGIDFASVHMYPDSWISQSITDAHIEFTRSWMQSHIDDAENYLGMPVVFSEFGVSTKDPGYNLTYRDTLIRTVYNTILNSTKKGGSGGGTLLWQIFPEGTDYMDDGYGIVLSKSPSTSNIISLQSKRLKTFNSLCSWRCKWGCKKKHSSQNLLSHDEL